jgi:hypothetical protein
VDPAAPQLEFFDRWVGLRPAARDLHARELVELVLSGDLDRFKVAIGPDLKAVREFQICRVDLPPDLGRRPRKGCDLLTLAAGLKRTAFVKFLLSFVGLIPTFESVSAAIAAGENALVKLLFEGLPSEVQVGELVVFAKVAAEFCRFGLLRWFVQRSSDGSVARRVVGFASGRGLAAALESLSFDLGTVDEFGWPSAAFGAELQTEFS